MEEYLNYMKTLRSQMSDVEDQAAKISVEEQMHIVTIQTMENDLNSAKSETKQLKDDAEQMMTLELIQQERVSLSAKLKDKRAYYSKVAEDISHKLQEQQDWVNSIKVSRNMGEHGFSLLKGYLAFIAISPWKNEVQKDLMAKLDSAKAKLDQIAQMKAQLVSENFKVQRSLKEVNCRANVFKPELLAMDISTLEEEQKALLSDKSGEAEFLHSLQDQIKQVEGISHVIKCACGEEFKVDLCI
ncbi:hypothetical protein SLEP1_g12268 [Rubroshorea leprosula]|uniref:Uncharacterized protein n=1 Tax=Rubroshorea leprosula TaxID=152421 RepID=A0AAV5IHT0_9ROSI|nr:hypothetical protein SLEP1_g12268 [Rubroshorea leprosula]